MPVSETWIFYFTLLQLKDLSEKKSKFPEAMFRKSISSDFTAGRGHFELLKFPLTRLNGQFILFPTLISKHWQKEKKVPAMRLYLPSNLPISGLKFIEKQIF